MNAIFNAAYLAIVLSFIRKTVSKLSVPFTCRIRTETRVHSDEYYVVVCGSPIYWSDDKNECLCMCWAAIRRCRGLAGELSIVEDANRVLVDEWSLPLPDEAKVALGEAIDEMDGN